MPVDPRFTFATFRDGDEEQILELFARAFPHAPRGVEHFRWEYQRNPFGNERIALTFDESGGLVGALRRLSGADRRRRPRADRASDRRHHDRPLRAPGRPRSDQHPGAHGAAFLRCLLPRQGGVQLRLHTSRIASSPSASSRSDARRAGAVSRARPDAESVRSDHARASGWLRGWQLELVQRGRRRVRRASSRASRPRTDFSSAAMRVICAGAISSVPTFRTSSSPSASGGASSAGASSAFASSRLAWGDALFDPRYPRRGRSAAAPRRAELSGRSRSRLVSGAAGMVRRDSARDCSSSRSPEPQDLSLMCVPFDAGRRQRAHRRSSLLHVWRQRSCSDAPSGQRSACRSQQSVEWKRERGMNEVQNRRARSGDEADRRRRPETRSRHRRRSAVARHARRGAAAGTASRCCSPATAAKAIAR